MPWKPEPPAAVNSHFELRHMKDNGRIEVSKDENGNEVMKDKS